MAGDSEITFQALRTVRLEPLGLAGEEWRAQVRTLEAEAMREHKRRMVNRARQAPWEGENANVTRPFVEEQGEQYEAALTQANTLATLFEDGYRRLRICQTDLDTAITNATSRGLTVTTDGTVTAPTPQPGTPDIQAGDHAGDVIATSEEITAILQRATEIDAALTQALHDTAGDDPQRFNPVRYDSLSAAESAYRDAQRVLTLTEQGGDLTDEELRTLTTLLHNNANDPAFAENVALGLGAEGALRFWGDVSGSRDFRPDSDEWRLLENLQQGLGEVFGLATRSDSPAMEGWEANVVALGDELLGGESRGFPWGFQVMSSLMQHGAYDEDFLVAYGDALVRAEQEDERFRPDMWEISSQAHRLSFNSENDPGLDPMIGLMDAFGRSPHAATDFFGVDENFDYLTLDRNWPTDFMGAGATVQDSDAGHSALGDALLAATTGQSTDHWSAGSLEDVLAADRRTPEAARVMQQVMLLFGSESPSLLSDQPSMADSLGRMAAAYIDDINHSVAEWGGADRGLLNEVFSSPHGGDITDRYSALPFLTILGQNETAYGLVSQAEHLYTMSSLDRFPPLGQESFDRGAQLLETYSQVRGILDHAWVEQVASDLGTESQEGIEAIERSNEWRSTLLNAGIGAGIGLGLGTAVVAAPTAGAAAGLLLPIAVEGGGEFLKTFLGPSLEGEFDIEGNLLEAQDVSQRFYQAGETNIATLAGMYLRDAEEGLMHEENDLYRDLADGYRAGGIDDSRLGGIPNS